MAQDFRAFKAKFPVCSYKDDIMALLQSRNTSLNYQPHFSYEMIWGKNITTRKWYKQIKHESTNEMFPFPTG